MDFTKSEMDGMIALAAAGQLRGDKRTDAKAGTIHAPTAARLVKKGVSSLSSGLYSLTAAGVAAVPGNSAALVKPKAETKAKTETKSAAKPKPETKAETPKAKKEPMLAVGIGIMPEVAKKEPKPKGEPKAKAEAPKVAPAPVATPPKNMATPLGTSRRRKSEPKAEAAPKAEAKSEPPKVGAKLEGPRPPAIVTEALTAQPVASPAIVASQAPVASSGSKNVDEAVRLLHESGTLLFVLEGKRGRINANERHGSITYWENWTYGEWRRVLIGELMDFLGKVKVLNNERLPGMMPIQSASLTS